MSDTGRVLVVGPDVDARNRAAEAVERRRDDVCVAAATPADAARAADDVVCLVGLHGPDCDGLELLADGRSGADAPPVVLLLDDGCDVTVADALDAGAADALRRTGDWPGRLAARVDRAIHAADRTAKLGTYETVVESMLESTRLLDEEGDLAVVDDDRDDLLGEAAVLAGERSEGRVEADLADEDGEGVTAGARPTPVDGDGEVGGERDGAAAVTRDVSERRAVERELRENETALRDLYELSTRTDLDFEEKVRRMLVVGRDRVDLDVGFLSLITPEAEGDEFRVVVHDGSDEALEDHTMPLSETYCRETIERDEPLAIVDAAESHDDHPGYATHGFACYLGSRVELDGELYGTLCFGAAEPREEPFSESERVFVDLLTQWVRYELERRERERDLREARQRAEDVLDRIDDGFFAVDEDWAFTYFNPAAEALLGIDADAVLGESVWDTFPEATEREFYDEYHEAMERQEPTSFEEYFPPLDTWFSVSAYPSPDGLSVYFEDVTDRKRRERSIQDLYEVSSRTDIDFEEKVRRVIDTGRERVGMEAGFFATVDTGVDPATGGFRVVVDDGNDPQFGDHAESPLAETYCRKAIDRDDPLGVTNAPEEGWADDPAYEEYGLSCYLGGRVEVDGDLYGTLCFTARDPRAEPFTEGERQFVNLLTQWLSYELERREREATLRQLLDRVNGLVHDVVEILVEAATREEIDERVVERLAAVEDYDLAWVGELDITGETVTPVAWAGDADVDLAGTTFPLDADPPGASVRAVREGAVQLQDFTVDPPGEHCAHDVEAHSLRAAIAVPLAYKDAEYGVLTVYTDDPDALDEREQVVLSALGRAIADAYNAIETGRILSTDQVVELNVTIGDGDLLFNRIATGADCRVEYAGSVYKPDGSLRLFATTTGADAEAVLDAAGAAGVDDAVCLAEGDDECLLELGVAESLVETLADHGAVTRALESDAGQARLTVELPAEADARDLYELVADRYAETELRGYHEHDRPVETRQEFRASLEDRLTDRQQTALQTSFLSGFFEWPRPVSGDELAESMGISRPTFHQHLRAAEKKVLEELFDPPE